MEYFVRIIEATVWPIFIGTILIVFRNDIRKAISLMKLKKFKYGQMELELEIEQLKTKAESINPSLLADPKTLLGKDDLLKLSIKNPNAAIAESWRSLETDLRRHIIRNSGSPQPDLSTSLKIVEELERMNLLSEEDQSLVRSLRGIMKEASNKYNFGLTEASAFQYIEMAESIKDKVKNLAIGEL